MAAGHAERLWQSGLSSAILPVLRTVRLIGPCEYARAEPRHAKGNTNCSHPSPVSVESIQVGHWPRERLRTQTICGTRGLRGVRAQRSLGTVTPATRTEYVEQPKKFTVAGSAPMLHPLSVLHLPEPSASLCKPPRTNHGREHLASCQMCRNGGRPFSSHDSKRSQHGPKLVY